MIEFKETLSDGSQVVVTAPDGLTYGELIQRFKAFSVAIGYHPGTVDNYIDDGEPFEDILAKTTD